MINDINEAQKLINSHDRIYKIIESCNNDHHFQGVDTLIELWHQRFKNEGMADSLKLARQRKWNNIHDIIQ